MIPSRPAATPRPPRPSNHCRLLFQICPSPAPRSRRGCGPERRSADPGARVGSRPGADRRSHWRSGGTRPASRRSPGARPQRRRTAPNVRVKTAHGANDNDTLRRSGPQATRYSQPARGQTFPRTGPPADRHRYAGPGSRRGRTTATSVAAKSSPMHSTGCPVRSASAYVKQSPKFSPAG